MDKEKLIYEWIVPDDQPNFTGHDDLAEAFRVYEVPSASGGIMIHAKYCGDWSVNPWGLRPLVRHLLKCLSNNKIQSDAISCPLYTDYKKSCVALKERDAELKRR